LSVFIINANQFLKSFYLRFKILFQKRDAAYTTVKPLVAGTVAIVRGLADQPGEHYKAAEQRVQELNAAGHNISLPRPDQIQNFHDKVT